MRTCFSGCYGRVGKRCTVIRVFFRSKFKAECDQRSRMAAHQRGLSKRASPCSAIWEKVSSCGMPDFKATSDRVTSSLSSREIVRNVITVCVSETVLLLHQGEESVHLTQSFDEAVNSWNKFIGNIEKNELTILKNFFLWKKRLSAISNLFFSEWDGSRKYSQDSSQKSYLEFSPLLDVRDRRFVLRSPQCPDWAAFESMCWNQTIRGNEILILFTDSSRTKHRETTRVE